MTIASLSGAAAVTQREAVPNDAARLRQAAEGFEALFLQQMMKTARSASLGEGILSSSGGDTMQSMLDQKLTETSAGRSNLGIASALYAQFSAAAGIRE